MPLNHPATRRDSPFTAQSFKFKNQSVHHVISGRISKPHPNVAIVRREDRREQQLRRQLLRQIRHSDPLCFHKNKLEELHEKKLGRQIGDEILVSKARRYRPHGPRRTVLKKQVTKKEVTKNERKKETLEEWIRRQQREYQQEAQKRAQQFESYRQNRLIQRKKQEPLYMEPGPVQRTKQPYEREKFIHEAEKDTKKKAKELARFFLIRDMEREAGAYQLIIWGQQRGKIPADEWLKKRMALVTELPGMPSVPDSQSKGQQHSQPKSQGPQPHGQYTQNSTNSARMPQHSCTGWIFDGLNANGNATWYCVRDDYDALLAQQFAQQPLNSEPQPHNLSVPSDTSSRPNPAGPRGYATQNIGREEAGSAAREQDRQEEAANSSFSDSFSQQKEAPKMTESSGRAYAESMRQQQDAGRAAYETEQQRNTANAGSYYSRDKYFQQKQAQEEAARAARDQERRRHFEFSGEAFRRHRQERSQQEEAKQAYQETLRQEQEHARKQKEWTDRVDAENARDQQEAAHRAYAEGARQQQAANRKPEPAGWAYQESLRTQERIRQANQQREETQRRFKEGKKQQRKEQQEWEKRNGRRAWDGTTPHNQPPFTFPRPKQPVGQHQHPQPIQTWEAYQESWEEFIPGSQTPLPVPTGLLCDFSAQNIWRFYYTYHPQKEDRIKVLKEERKRWHPDKVEQKVGKLDAKMLETVKEVFQIVDELFGRETGRKARSTGLKEN